MSNKTTKVSALYSDGTGKAHRGECKTCSMATSTASTSLGPLGLAFTARHGVGGSDVDGAPARALLSVL